MSYSGIYGIKKDFHGKELFTYDNAWLFSPMIWNILEKKYNTKPVLSYFGENGFSEINRIMNKGKNFAEQICWELSHSQIFFTRDKIAIADCIEKFANENSSNLNIGRFLLIANDIRNIDENIYPYFVFKATSCDDNVEWWFGDLDDGYGKSLLDNEVIHVDFVSIKNNKAHFISFEEFKKNIIKKKNGV
jgi:hypothetical protein